MSDGALVRSDWLAEHLVGPDLRILDCTWHHVSTNLDGRTQYRGRHLPGRCAFRYRSRLRSYEPRCPHMLPSPEDFAKEGWASRDWQRKSYCGRPDRASGASLSAARVWWMFRVFGHENVAVLDGGLTKWSKEKLRQPK